MGCLTDIRQTLHLPLLCFLRADHRGADSESGALCVSCSVLVGARLSQQLTVPCTLCRRQQGVHCTTSLLVCSFSLLLALSELSWLSLRLCCCSSAAATGAGKGAGGSMAVAGSAAAGGGGSPARNLRRTPRQSDPGNLTRCRHPRADCSSAEPRHALVATLEFHRTGPAGARALGCL